MDFDRSPANLIRILSHSRLFYGMPPSSLLDLIAHGQVEKWEPGRPYRLPANELRIILEGDMTLQSSESVELGLGRGNFVGEAGLVDLALGPLLDYFEARSHDGCVCIVITPHEIHSWIKRHPRLEGRFYRQLSQELLNRRWAEEIPTAVVSPTRFRKSG